MSKKTPIARILIENDGKYLIVRRSEGGTRPGEWEIPGGKVDNNEDYEAAARRETMEETGIAINNLSYHSSSAYSVDGDDRLSVLFTGDTEQKEVILSEEHDTYEWIDESNYHNFSLDEHYKTLFDELFSASVNAGEITNNVDAKTTKADALLIYTDGGSRGNPGPSASGYVIMNHDKEVLEEGGEYLGITTNNQAEYQAVKLALEMAKKYGKVDVSFKIDSLLVVNQMNGIYKIKNRDLWPIHERIKELAKDFKSVTFAHVRREDNKLADAKVNEVLDSHQ